MSIYSIAVGNHTLYDLIHFPGGELHVRLLDPTMDEVNKADQVVVTARIADSQSLIETLLLCDAVRQDSKKSITLILPYLPYGRADRRFSSTDCLGIGTFAKIIKCADALTVTLDAHSAKGLACFDHIVDIPADHFIQKAYENFSTEAKEPVTLLFPDKGARDRYEAVSGRYDNVLHCAKERNLLTGKLKGFKVPDRSEFKTKKVLLVDDICDGGGTFNGIANGVKDYGLELGLYVTHGIFSKGFNDLSTRFQHFYTTDSFKPVASFGNIGSAHLDVFETQEFFLQNLPVYQPT